MRKRTKQRIDCYHENAVGIYGDPINMHNGARGWCPDCKTYLSKLPPKERTWTFGS